MKTIGPFKLILIFSLIVALLFVFFLGKKAISLNLNYFKKDKTSAETTTRNIQPLPPIKPNETEIIVTETDIQNTISQYNPDGLTEISVKINPDGIGIQGKAETMIVKNDLKIKLLPEVTNERISVRITEAKAGIFNAPDWLIEKINPLIEDYLKNNINDKGSISGFQLSDGKLTVRVRSL